MFGIGNRDLECGRLVAVHYPTQVSVVGLGGVFCSLEVYFE